MFESLVSVNNVSFILVFLEGILSFFSPCIIPLIPVYMSYLAGNTNDVSSNEEISYKRKQVFFHTVFFILGISFSFFILGISFTSFGRFFQSHKLLLTRIGGILIIILGLFQLGVLDFKFLNQERKIHLNLANKKVNPLTAFLLGITFSFSWTPCVGPALSSVLILASSANSTFLGNVLILIYSLGFIIPFILLGLFTSQVLNVLKSHQKLLKYTVKIGGVILMIIGIMIFTGWMNGISGYLNSLDSSNTPDVNEEEQIPIEKEEKEPSSAGSTDQGEQQAEITSAIDFTLVDQYGNEHTLSDYKGKIVFLNFWATWCPPCKKEMPYIEEIYHDYNENQEDVIILGVANPKNQPNPNNIDVKKEEIIAYLKENDYNFPVLFDETGKIFNQYAVSSIPTTFMIDKEGNIHGYVPGMISTKDMINDIIQDTLNSSANNE